MVYQLLQQFVVDVTVKEHLVPVLFVEVIGTFDGSIVLPQFECIFGVAFQTNLVGAFQVDKCKHFIHDFHHKRVFVERKAFRDGLFAEAIFAGGFYVHDGIYGFTVYNLRLK